MANSYRNVLICIFTMFQEVSLFIDNCGSFSCIDSYCCQMSCCFMKPYPPQFPDSPGFTDSPAFIFIMVFFGIFGVMVFGMICWQCSKMCKEPEEPRPAEATRRRQIQPPPIAPPVPTAPSFIQASDPPPYSEVIGQPYVVHVAQPPCYDNIAMEDCSSWKRPQPSESIPNYV